MSERQWRTAQAAERVNEGVWSLQQGALALGLSQRQMRRICARVGEAGAAAVGHAGRRRVPVNRTKQTDIERILELLNSKFQCNFQP